MHLNNLVRATPKLRTVAAETRKQETPVTPTPEPEKAPEQVQATQATVPAVATPTVVSTSHEDLMIAAGIKPADYGAVDYIISHESSWNPNATEPHTGAHGLPQALPYSKTGCDWSDAVCQLKWASTYATVRYGGWWGAYNQWQAYRWW